MPDELEYKLEEIDREIYRVDILKLARAVFAECKQNELITRASAIAFTAMVTTVPFLALIITIAVYCIPDQNIPGTVDFCTSMSAQIESMSGKVIPPEAAAIIQNQIERLQDKPRAAVLSTGLLVTVWLSSSLFISVIDALNKIYGVEETRPYWKLRLIAVFMALVQSVIVIATVSAIVAWPLWVSMFGWSTGEASFANFVSWTLSFLMVLLTFAITFRIGPSVKARDKYVLPGSLFGTVGFLITTYGFRIYVENSSRYDAMYGSLGGVMVLMIWFYISSFVLLLAGQINKYFMQRRHSLEKRS
ncbi:MAG: YihY/virulence factor BrkB family protein [Candidatus Obscuribacterales bacterium]|nr:YihY/virulence factor BrkB family protein [Candidatus Obscuribacterales bacterium]